MNFDFPWLASGNLARYRTRAMIRRRYLPISDNRSENKKNFFCALVAVRDITGTGEAAGAGEFYKGKMEKSPADVGTGIR